MLACRIVVAGGREVKQILCNRLITPRLGLIFFRFVVDGTLLRLRALFAEQTER